MTAQGVAGTLWIMATPVVDEALGRTSRNIETIRAYFAVRQEDLGRAFGSNQAGVSKRLLGQVRWSIPELELVAKAFSCELRHLVGSPSDIPWESLRWNPPSRSSGPKGKAPHKAKRKQPAGKDTSVLPARKESVAA